jgi:hypothetical protein
MVRKTSVIATLASIALVLTAFFAFGSASPATATGTSAIYWANYNNDSMGMAGIDGSSPNQSFIPSGVEDSRAVSVDATYLY